MIPGWFHWHAWAVIVPNAMGRFEKQAGQQSVYQCAGRIERCGCGTLRLVPEDVWLSPVRVQPWEEAGGEQAG